MEKINQIIMLYTIHMPHISLMNHDPTTDAELVEKFMVVKVEGDSIVILVGKTSTLLWTVP